MTRAAVRKADIERAVAAVKAAGCEVLFVEVRRDGTIRVVTGLTKGESAALNPWDKTCAVE